jgi:hypothetical protein
MSDKRSGKKAKAIRPAATPKTEGEAIVISDLTTTPRMKKKGK